MPLTAPRLAVQCRPGPVGLALPCSHNAALQNQEYTLGGDSMTAQVLLVDDSAMSRRITLRALPREWDTRLVELDNGAAAIDTCCREAVDLMLLDLTMPGLSGFDVLRRLNERGALPPVVVISADAQAKAEEQARSLGARAFLRKPLDADALGDTLRSLGLL